MAEPLPHPPGPPVRPPAIEIGLNAAIVAVDGHTPLILVIAPPAQDGTESLPFGLFDPLRHRTMEIGLRDWVVAQTQLRLGYVEQLYTFGDRGRLAQPGDAAPHVMSVGYLALTRRSADSAEALARSRAEWRDWYDYFPWEDWRGGPPPQLASVILPALAAWCARPPEEPASSHPIGRRDRVRLAFGQDGLPWDEERVLERFELLYEAGLAEEAVRDGRASPGPWPDPPRLGRPMQHDHRRILATAISRLRGKLKYRPVVFELMAETFTLTELQRTVEAISGRHLHKQNFRRLVEQGDLVERTGGASLSTGGRPAALFRFRREVMQERPAPGLRLGVRS
ncbi:NUDIX hydrolase [Propylenella binzhouense]|uniref:NAD regulator n=1 Tax=Propylenella binzhouense TaxID=2555902 RepID=A0A964T4C7_9HYPH|nr:NAD regulator [Propylenella binzhouense]MYZ48150.1 NAD regulator [Propylenella binzhouense]